MSVKRDKGTALGGSSLKGCASRFPQHGPTGSLHKITIGLRGVV